MTKKYYKVVNCNLCSVASPGIKTDLDKRELVRYKLGEWVDAPKQRFIDKQTVSHFFPF